MTELELFRRDTLCSIRSLVGNGHGKGVRRKELDKTYNVTKSPEVKDWFVTENGNLKVNMKSPDGCLEAEFTNYLYESSVWVNLSLLRPSEKQPLGTFEIRAGNRRVGDLWDSFLDYRRGIHEFTKFELVSIPKLLEKEGFPKKNLDVERMEILNLSFYLKNYLSLPVDIQMITRLYGHMTFDVQEASKELGMIKNSPINRLVKTITKVQGKIDLSYLEDVISDERSEKRRKRKNDLENSIREYYLLQESLRDAMSEKYNIPKDLIDPLMFDLEKDEMRSFNYRMYTGIS